MSEKMAGEGSDPVNDIFSGARDDRDLSEMVARDGQPVITRFTVMLGLAALFLGGIIAGTYFQSSSGSAATGGGAALASARAAGAGSSTRGTGGGFGTPVASGQIQLIDGSNVYVTTQTGSIVKVATDATTRIRKSATLTVKQLKIGDTVSVSGSDGADGTVTATSINVGALPAGLGGATRGTGGAASNTTTSASPRPPVAGGGGAGRNPALIACLKKNGVTIDPTQGTRGLRNSTDPKVQAAFAKCRTSAFPSGGTSPTATP
jgi:hypothetical protein